MQLIDRPPLSASGPGRVTESFDETRFRQVLSQFASGIIVVTGATDDGPAGLTCQSFSSLSLRPPLVLLSTARTSTTWPRIRAGGRFAVNVLEAGQHAVSAAFARSGTDRFAGLAWRTGALGSPLIDGALAHIECDLHAVHEGGDHEIVIGRVRAVEVEGLDEHRSPLVYFRSRYRTLAD